jgi:hypothetical protein
VQAFIGTADYQAHKRKRFRGGDNPNIAENQAFILAEPESRKRQSIVEPADEIGGLIHGGGIVIDEGRRLHADEALGDMRANIKIFAPRRAGASATRRQAMFQPSTLRTGVSGLRPVRCRASVSLPVSSQVPLTARSA